MKRSNRDTCFTLILFYHYSKLQSFQYRIIHKIIPCNKWLHTIKIKKDKMYNFCSEVDDMIHFFINCPKVKQFWSFWLNWWEKISGIPIKYSTVLKEYIMLWFPTNKDEILVLNYCIFHTKYYIYLYTYKDYTIKII